MAAAYDPLFAATPGAGLPHVRSYWAATAGELPADYEEKALAIAERQIALAGYRLTDEVREALK